MDNLDRDIKMTNADILIRDDSITIIEHGNTTTEGIMLTIRAGKIQLGSALRDQDFEILGASGSLLVDSGLGALRMTSMPIIGSQIAYPLTTLTNLTSAAGYTMTATQLLSGLIIDATNTGGIAATMPTVAATVALIPGWVAGTSFLLWYKNTGNQTMTLTVDASAQWTMTGTMTAALNTTRVFMCIIATAVTGTVYSLGTFAE